MMSRNFSNSAEIALFDSLAAFFAGTAAFLGAAVCWACAAKASARPDSARPDSARPDSARTAASLMLHMESLLPN